MADRFVRGFVCYRSILGSSRKSLDCERRCRATRYGHLLLFQSLPLIQLADIIRSVANRQFTVLGQVISVVLAGSGIVFAYLRCPLLSLLFVLWPCLIRSTNHAETYADQSGHVWCYFSDIS